MISVRAMSGPQGLSPHFLRLQVARLKSLGCNSSSAPPELDHFPLSTHGLRRGLDSCAASRLIYGMRLHFPEGPSVATQTLKPLRMTPVRFPASRPPGFRLTPNKSRCHYFGLRFSAENRKLPAPHPLHIRFSKLLHPAERSLQLRVRTLHLRFVCLRWNHHLLAYTQQRPRKRPGDHESIPGVQHP